MRAPAMPRAPPRSKGARAFAENGDDSTDTNAAFRIYCCRLSTAQQNRDCTRMHNAEANETEKSPWLLEAAEALDRAATEEASAAAAAAAEVALTAAEDAAAGAMHTERAGSWHFGSARLSATAEGIAGHLRQPKDPPPHDVEDVAQTEEPSWLSDAAVALAKPH